jgi:hypothetical protein
MSTLIYSTQKAFDGPWLVDRASLLQLGEIIDAISARFSEASAEHINAELLKTLERYSPENRENNRDELLEVLRRRYKLNKTITLSLSDSKYVNAESVAELVSLPELGDQLATGLEVEIETVQRSVRIKLEKNLFGGTSRLNIRTSPEIDELARQAFMDVQYWAISNQAPLWQRLWTNYYWYFVFVWCLALFVSTSFLPTNSQSIEQELRPAAIEILKDGISNENLPKAIELLLRTEFKVPVAEVKHQLPPWFKLLFFGGLATTIVLWFRPSLEFGIGRSVTRIARWRWWLRFVGITLPSFIFASVLWPHVSQLI